VTRIGLVGCVKRKGTDPAPAKDLYRSPLFVGRRRYVEHTCEDWFILSAKHRLVRPEQVLAPYDETLVGKPRHELERWSAEVLFAIDALGVDYPSTVFEIHAGQTYRDFGLVGGLLARGARVEVPAEGLSQGQQLGFYSVSGADAVSQSGIDARPSIAGTARAAPSGDYGRLGATSTRLAPTR
jgi:hypothetical protein